MAVPNAAGTIVRGAGATAFGFAIRFGARIIFLAIAARLFGIALFGAYSLAVAAVELVVTVGGLGSKRLIFKQLEAERSRPAIHLILDAAVMVAGTSIILGLIFAGFAAARPAWLSGDVASALIMLSPMIVGQALLDLLLAGTRWTHAIRYEVTGRSIVEPYVTVIAAIAAYGLGFRTSGLPISYWAGTLAALGYAIFGLKRCFGSFDLGGYRFSPRRIVPLLRESAGATTNDVLNGLFGRIDLYMVGLFLGVAPAGIYGMARQIRTPVRQVRQSFDGLLNPIIARTLALKGPVRTGAATAAAARLILAVQLPMLIALALVGEPLLAWFGPGFVAGYWALLLLAAAEAIQGAFGVSDLIILYGRPLASLWIVGANIAFNILAGWLLIGRLGVTGAAIAVVAGVAAGAPLRRATLRRHFGVRIPLSYIAGPLLAGLSALAAALAVRAVLIGAAPAIVAIAGVSVGLLGYAAALKLWLRLSGDDLSLRHFEADSQADSG